MWPSTYWESSAIRWFHIAPCWSLKTPSYAPGRETWLSWISATGDFLPKELELGLKQEDVYEVKKGLEEGEKVVVSAQFLLDSESRLQEFIRKLTTESKKDKP